MAVENYFNRELSDIVFDIDALDEWKEIARDLGLENQLELSKGVASPVQYPFMNTVMERVYETLCPMKVDYKSYKNTTIPLEVLKQIAFSVKEGNFDRIQIWYDDKSPDPLVVGYIIDHYGYYRDGDKKQLRCVDEKGDSIDFKDKVEHEKWCKDRGFLPDGFYEKLATKYLIARWGDELRDFAELKEMALKRFVENESGEMKRRIAEYTEKLNLIKENAVSYFNGNISKHQATLGW